MDIFYIIFREFSKHHGRKIDMQVLQNMDMDTFVIVVPAVLIGLYAIISIQKALSFRNNPYTGLIIPALCLIVATILAFRPMFMLDASGSLFGFCIKMWFIFNIPTVVLLFPYFKGRQNAKVMAAMAEAMNQSEETAATAE